jgi:voltage-gated sodium channel
MKALAPVEGTQGKQVVQETMSCVEGTPFQLFGAFLIISNALVIGLETDLGDWAYWPIVEKAFLIAFTLELLTRICLIGPITFICRHPDVHWNTFDVFIVSLGLFDFAYKHLTGKKGAGSFATLFRIIRLLRIMRIFRILKFLKELYVLIYGLVEAVKAVSWVTLLMVFILYVCSIVLVKTVGRPSEDDPYKEFMDYRFGHIMDSMLTLFILMTCPNIYEYEEQPGLLQSHPVLTMFLCSFVIFGSFGVVALLTGVISQSMTEKNEARKNEVRAEHEHMRAQLGTKCEELFSELRVDGNGEASVETVKRLAPDMWKLLKQIGADITHADVERIIDFMDVNGTGLIGMMEFRSTMEKIAEGLSPLGIQEIANRIGVCETKIDKLTDNLMAIQKKNEALQSGMRSLLERLGNRASPASLL